MQALETEADEELITGDALQVRRPGDPRRPRRRALRREGRPRPLPAGHRRRPPAGAHAAAAHGRRLAGHGRAAPRRPQGGDGEARPDAAERPSAHGPAAPGAGQPSPGLERPDPRPRHPVDHPRGHPAARRSASGSSTGSARPRRDRRSAPRCRSVRWPSSCPRHARASSAGAGRPPRWPRRGAAAPAEPGPVCGRYTVSTGDVAGAAVALRPRRAPGGPRGASTSRPGDEVLAVTGREGGRGVLRWGLVCTGRAASSTRRSTPGPSRWPSSRPSASRSRRGPLPGRRRRLLRVAASRGGRKQPFWITPRRPARRSPSPGCASAARRRREPAALVPIVTTAATPSLADAARPDAGHPRPGAEAAWLDPATPPADALGAARALRPGTDRLPVGTAVNDARYDGPDCLDPRRRRRPPRRCSERRRGALAPASPATTTCSRPRRLRLGGDSRPGAVERSPRCMRPGRLAFRHATTARQRRGGRRAQALAPRLPGGAGGRHRRRRHASSSAPASGWRAAS